ncbi:xylosidase/arabinosidase [Paenibacillus sp. CCS19]|uniref:glycoside hydrolase family 43 protein n=1 Tax=Paenibacillus sp. CCS19 TaxID=3158387 RepID=UPI00255E37E2|nr:glycoside hydrolase family 43 protein [Paenibacillus cellulosilyticus]GMK38039.1 xylosidase/arabinosidase [Paenibacillus cellulosilyticus]
MRTFRNPILPGFYPDPSICRVDEDYYMVTSTFEYFPGVPIFHSRDLVNWRQIGHVLDRPSQLDLSGVPASRGIYAPTIRYHEGVFYMVTTFVESAAGARRNFYVTTQDPAGPWSEPNWLEEAPGIDPSLFFDTDGRAYYTGNRMPPGGQRYPKHMEIWLQELDLDKKQLVGPTYSLWDGALNGIHAQEGPHLYKVGEWYYLLIAEGGTGFTHSVTVARSRSLTGPYETGKTNPILTHRHLGRGADIVNVGHADLVEAHNGEWWLVCLGSRPYGGPFRNMGRETFLAPLAWEEGWPVVNPGKGIIEEVMRAPNLPEHRWPSASSCDNFDRFALDNIWCFIRTPAGELYSLRERPGFLRLKSKPVRMTEEGANPAFVGRRQQHASFAVRTALEWEPANKSEAGIVFLSSHAYHYRLEIADAIAEEGRVIRLVRTEAGIETTLAQSPLPPEAGSRMYLKLEAYGQKLTFSYGIESEQWKVLAEGVDGTIVSTDVAGGFTGAMIGMFTVCEAGIGAADFDYFEYAPL